MPCEVYTYLVINSITRDECFHQLRTIRQLGYSVRCSLIQDPGGIGSYVILIQSMNSTQVLLESINEFIGYTTDYLEMIPEVVVQGRINQTIDQLQRQRFEFVFLHNYKLLDSV